MNYLAPFEFYVLINVEKLPLSIFPHSPKLSQITVSSTLINFHSTFSNSRNFPKTEEARALLLCDKTETTVFLADRLRSEDPEFALCPCRYKRCDQPSSTGSRGLAGQDNAVGHGAQGMKRKGCILLPSRGSYMTCYIVF